MDICIADVAALGDFAAQRLGTVHRWINNAGQVTRKRLLTDLDATEIADVVGANILGSLLCCRCAAPRFNHSQVRARYIVGLTVSVIVSLNLGLTGQHTPVTSSKS